MQEESSSSLLSVCPSFNSYSSNNKLAEVAAKVTEGFSRESECSFDKLPPIESSREGEEEEEEEEFEFALVRPDPDSISILSGEIFYDGQIRPIFPIFNRDLLLDDGDHEIHDRELSSTRDVSSIQVPLKKLFIDEHDVPSSASSSEADELERIPPGTYCVWSPKAVEASPGRCKKSNSTGSSSKRWRFRDLLRRSNSDGKDSFVFLTPSTTNTSKKREEKSDQKVENLKERRNSSEVKVAGKLKAKGVAGDKVSAHEMFYVRNRAIKEGDKKRSYLPYRQDLVGFFVNVNGLSRNFSPF